MSYTPTTWTTGDTITATKLNKMEQGIASAGGGVSGLCTDTSGTLDKSYNDLVAILEGGATPYIFQNGTVYTFEFADIGEFYEVNFYCAINSDGLMYVASDADDPLVLD